MPVPPTCRRTLMNNIEQLVRNLLADHLEVGPESLHDTDRLDGDLGMSPLAVVLVVLDVEDAVESFVQFEQLGAVKTVADLIDLFRGKALRVPRLRALRV